MITLQSNGRLEYLLDDQCWYMKQMNPEQGVKEGIHLLPAERDLSFTGWNKGFVPGDVYSDLQRAGAIDDPYVGRNLVKLSWVQYYEWWYVCRFNAPKEFNDMKLQLILEGVDYSCDAWLNGSYLGQHEGMFSPIKFDISRYLNTEIDINNSSECDNFLAIKIDPVPQSLYNIAGKHHTFSGDYLPGFVPAGIWRSVKIVGTKGVRIEEMQIQSKIQPETNSAKISVNSEIEVLTGDLKEYEIHTKIYNKNGESFTDVQKVVMNSGTNEISQEITVDNAKIWWPWDMGDQPLYYCEITVYLDGVEVDKKENRFGIREVTMKMNPGRTKEEAEFPWTFVINGKEIFLRSGCWGGPPSFLYGRNKVEKYQHLLKLAKECNLNNLRMFGWHPPEVKEFYDICDEIGITVWTNFPLASQVLRDDVPYVNSVLSECGEIVKERRNHPSNIFWMGGEEVFFSQAQVNSHNKAMMRKIGKYIKDFTNIPYADASMMSSAPAIKLGYKPRECIHANGAYYAAGTRFIEDYFKLVDACIVPELAAASAPCVESLKKFVPKEDLWPLGPTWGYLQANVDILKAVNFEIFGDTKFGSIEEFATATQISQGECFKFGIESFRRRKPKVSGVAICHFITNRPLMKWEIVDYYGVKKLSYDYVQTAFQPILASLDYPKRRYMPDENFVADLYIINDLYKSYNEVECKVEMFDSQGNISQSMVKKVEIAENCCYNAFTFEGAVKGQKGETFEIKITLTHNGEILSTNEYKLLIENQEEMRVKAKELYQVHRERTLKYGHTLYRDFPECYELD